MATETLKVFTNVVDATSTSQSTSISIANTDATTQAVIKNLEYSASDPRYSVDMAVTLDGKDISSTSAIPTETALDSLSGTQIVDVSNNLSITMSTDSDIKAVTDKSALFHNYASTSYRHYLTGASTIKATREEAFDTVYPKYTYGSIDSGIPAESACGWYEGATSKYARCESNTLYIMNSSGSTLFSRALTETTHGITTDGTYIYSKRTSSDTTIQRTLCSDGTAATDLTTDTAFAGQAHNQGAFFLYHSGYLYCKNTASNSTVYKINISTGAVTSFYMGVAGNYCIGGIITENASGVPFLIQANAQSTNQVVCRNLDTEVNYNLTAPSLGASTEYGNMALEISAGLCCFFYNSVFIWVDVNNTPVCSDSTLSNTTYNFPNISSSSTSCSIGSTPLYLNTTAVTIPRDITYSLYADGVEITGV